MDGKNSSGRRISLLNDAEERPPARRQPSAIAPRSRTCSYASSSSPPTPLLERSDSTDSHAMNTPSPTTPDFTFDGLAPQPLMASPVFSYFPKDQASAYPPVPQSAGSLPYLAGHVAYFQAQPAPQEPQASSNPRSKKNSYPCPMAKQYSCSDYFTTSGHAARHAKKHTGKKDAFCPECNKAFTRKDNMEQHRRTHQTGRNSTKGSEDRSKKPKLQAEKRPKPAPLQSSAASLSALSVMDSALPLSPASSFSLAPAVQPVDCYPQDYSHRSPYPDPTQYATPAYHLGGGSAYGLDALAIAASGEKRKLEP